MTSIEGGSASGGPSHVLRVDPAAVQSLAREHDVNAAAILNWANGDPGFAEEFLRTHGNVNFGTYLQVQQYLASKLSAGNSFAADQAGTAAKLRFVIEDTAGIDAAGAARVRTAGN